MRRSLIAAALVSLVAAAPARADETITARAPNQFGSAVTTIDQGEKVTFSNLDVVGHDVTAAGRGPDGKPLFASGFVPAGSSAPVVGTEYLVTGTYPFVCTIHPGMDATLEVTSAGAPVARPAPPEVAVKVLSRKLRRVVRKRKLALRVSSTEAVVKLVARTKGAKLGRKTVRFDGAGERKVVLKLSKAARNALRGRRKAKVTVKATATDAAGQTATARGSRKLR